MMVGVCAGFGSLGAGRRATEERSRFRPRRCRGAQRVRRRAGGRRGTSTGPCDETAAAATGAGGRLPGCLADRPAPRRRVGRACRGGVAARERWALHKRTTISKRIVLSYQPSDAPADCMKMRCCMINSGPNFGITLLERKVALAALYFRDVPPANGMLHATAG